MRDFNCSLCGKCCASVGKTVSHAKQLVASGDMGILTNEIAKFPFKYDENGRCEKLGEDNKCMVYESRPDVCSIDKMWARHTSFIPKEDYYQIAESICKKLQEDGL